MLKLGEKIKQLRQMLGLSQFDLAQKAELSNDYISKIEKSKISNIGIVNLVALARALERDPAEFLEYYLSPQKPKLTLGKKIAAIRKYKKISQEDLAKRAQIRLRWLQRIEADLDESISDHLVPLAKALKIELRDLIDKEPDKILGVPALELVDNYVSKALPETMLYNLGGRRDEFYDENWLPKPGSGKFGAERNLRIEDDSAYVFKLTKFEEAMPPIGEGWALYVSPGAELEDGNLVIVGTKNPNAKGLKLDDAYRILFREVWFQSNSLVLKAYNPNYSPLVIQRDDVYFVHKVILCRPPGTLRKPMADYEKRPRSYPKSYVNLVDYWNKKDGEKTEK